MELICTGCFTNPVAANRGTAHVAREILVCTLGAAALPWSAPAQAVLRCSYCGTTVHLDHHHAVWYDT